MPGSHSYQFGPYRLLVPGALLYRHEELVPLPPKAAQTLLFLVERAGQVVEKETLLHNVWEGAFVEEGSLVRTISILRKTLGSAPGGRDYIATLSKRGYRFAVPVREAASDTPDLGGSPVTLAVLPFENLTGTPDQDYFSDGLTEEMITQLARLSPERLRVIARTSAMQYKSTRKSIRAIGRELGASYVLEGSVRRDRLRVRISAQLICVDDESHLWAENFERDLHDMLALQAEVARAIAQQIRIKLTLGQRQRLDLDKARSVDPRAYELYLRGRHFWNLRTADGMKKSIACFEEALQFDGSYAAAHDGISDAYTMLACRGVMPATEAFHKARAAARQAVHLEPQLGEGFASLAHVRLHDWDWVGLEDDFLRALELSPGHAIAHYWYAEYLMTVGRPADAVARVTSAQQMDPLNPLFNASVGMVLYLARQYDRAIAELHRALDIDSHHFLLYFRLGLVYSQRGLAREAVAAMRKAVKLSGESTETRTGLAHAYAAAGDQAKMRRILDEVTRPASPYVSPYDVARVFALAGDKTSAFDWLHRAYAEHNPDLIELKSEPAFDSLHAEPQFRDLARRIGWPE